MDINYVSVICTLGVFILKMIAVLILTAILNSYQKQAENFVVAWVTVYLGEIACMIALSFFNMLYMLPLLVCLVCFLLAMFSFTFLLVKKKRIKLPNFKVKEWPDHLLVLFTIMAGFALWCIVRSFVYFDTTPDAQAYGMPRIFIFSTSGSLLTYMNTLSKNIFVNEWNGELNAVFYRVLTGDNISIPFANVEIYIYAMISFICMGKTFLKSKAVYVSWMVMFLPVTVFLSYTCKGDLLGMVSFPLFVLLVLDFWKKSREGKFNFILLVGAIEMGALASGARITNVPAVGLIMIIILLDLFVISKGRISLKQICIGLIAGIASYLAGWFRYILNFIIYGNLFERVDAANEKLAPNLSRFISTSSALLYDVFDSENIFTHKGTMWALSADAGILGPVFLIAGLTVILFLFPRFLSEKMYLRYWRETALAIAVVCAIGFMLISMDYYPWSFRYFASYFITAIIMVMLCTELLQRWQYNFIWSIILVASTINVYSTIALSTKEGEVTGDSFDNMVQKTSIERQYAFHSWIIDNPSESDVGDFYEVVCNNSSVLICNNVAQTISWAWGNNASNDVVLCIPEEFNSAYASRDWDMIVVSKTLDTDFLSIIDNSKYILYEPFGLDLSVFVNKKFSAYEGGFFAENSDNQPLPTGVLPYDGEYCWLDMEAEIPVVLDTAEGCVITYAAGTDLKCLNPEEEPQIEIYVDGNLVQTMTVEYSGEYQVFIPAEVFSTSEEYHRFLFKTNAVIGEYQEEGTNYCIRLKSISPL